MRRGWLALLLLPTLAMASEDWLSPRLHDHPLAGVIVDARGEPVAEAAVTAALASTRFAFIGEKHDNPDHHRIEADLIAARLAGQPGSAVVFEMLDDTQKPLLPKLSAGDDLATIKAKLAWPDKGWDFAVYGPLFQRSLKDGRLVAGNIDKPFIGRLYGEGDALFTGNPRFISVASATEATRTHLLDRIFDAHCGMQSRESLAPMLNIQLAKDASMADAMSGNAPALLVAGGEHARADTGVPSHLQARAGEANRIVVQLLEVAEGEMNARTYIDQAGPADFYWFTPATEVQDYCADVKGRAAK